VGDGETKKLWQQVRDEPKTVRATVEEKLSTAPLVKREKWGDLSRGLGALQKSGRRKKWKHRF